MRILQVVHQFFPDCHSGTEQYCLAHAREAQRRGDDVAVLSLHWDHDRDWPPVRLFEQPYEGLRVLRLNHWRRLNPNDVLRDHENLHLEGWFRRVLEQELPDVVHFFHLRQLGSNLIAVAKGLGVRTVVHLMDFWFLCPRFTLLRRDGSLCSGPPQGGAGCVPCAHPELQGQQPMLGSASVTDDPPARLRALLDRLPQQLHNLAAADHVVAPSRFLADLFVRNGFPAGRIAVIPYGLEAGRITGSPPQRPRQPLRLAFCGVLSPWKAPHLAIAAVRATASDVRLTVHGRLDEPLFADYIAGLRRDAEGDPRIQFADAYDASTVTQVFADMDALVVPSTWYENTPFVVLEAFAAGVPVLAADLGGLAEIVVHESNGLLFQAGDVAALRAAIDRLAGEPGLYARLQPTSPPSIAADHDRLERLYRS